MDIYKQVPVNLIPMLYKEKLKSVFDDLLEPILYDEIYFNFSMLHTVYSV